MEKVKYINEVANLLKCSKPKKAKILEDLEEIFNSVKENNRSVDSIIDGLGNPKEYAMDAMLSLGVDLKRKKQNSIILTVCLLVISIILIVSAVYVNANKIPSDVIGQADALTQIQISSVFALDFTALLLFGGILLGVIALIKIIKLYKTKG